MIQNPSLTPKRSRLWYYARSFLVLLAGIRLSPGLLVWIVRDRLTDPILVRLARSRCRFFVRNRLDVWILKEVCLDRDYERVGEPLADGWTIIDIGAGIGEFAIDAAMRCPRSVVHAFEPSPAAFALLCRNIELNQAGNVRPGQLAVWSRDGVAGLDVSAASTARLRRALEAEAAGDETVSVSCRTLEQVFQDRNITRCDFLKMDCEGAEYDVLLTAPAGVLDRVQRISLEYHDGPMHRHQELVDALRAARFSVTVTPSRAYREIGFLYASRAR